MRIEAYKKAICEIVQKDHIVVEIGSGLGTYSFFAAKAGARKVYAIENGPIIDVSKTIAKNNNLLDRIDFIEGFSTDVELPEKADILIFEDFGSFFITDKLNITINDAKRRFLNPQGTIIPAQIELHVALVGAEEIHKGIDSMTKEGDMHYGIDFSATKPLAMNNYYTKNISKEFLLTQPKLLMKFKLLDDNNFSFIKNVSFSARKGTIYGIVGWFDIKLSDSTMLFNSPSYTSTCWQQVFFPVETPIEVRKNEEINVELKCLQSKHGQNAWFSWQLETEYISYEGSTFKGFPLSIDDIKKKDKYFIPSATIECLISLFILEQINGKNSKFDISKKLYERYPDKFSSIDEASLRVSREIIKHC